METFTSQTIVMRVKEFGESDLLVTFLTPDRGLLKGVAKGARKSLKRFVNCLDIFSLVNLEYGPTRKGDLHFIDSGKLINSYPGLRTDFATLSKASYMIELTEILFPLELADPDIFEILKTAFHLLDKQDRIHQIPIIFEVMAMSLGGYGINLQRCCACGRRYAGEGTAVFKPDKGGIACLKCQQITAVCPKMGPDTVKVMRLMQSGQTSILDSINLPDELISEIRPVLKLHREYHLGKRPKSAEYLE